MMGRLLAAALAAIVLLGGSPQARAADEQVHRVGNGVSAPMVRYKTDPEYTDEARAAKIEGTVARGGASQMDIYAGCTEGRTGSGESGDRNQCQVEVGM
jgi:hypothetical protein